MKNEQREKAIKEWDNLSFEQKYFMIVKNKSIVKGYPDRSPDTLTGREIEEIINHNQKLPA